MNDFLEIGKVIFFVVLGIVTILIAVLMAKGTPFLTKGMRKKYTEESVKNYCKNNCFAEIIFAMGLILEGIFQDGVIYYLGIDFEKEYRLHYGIDYSDILKLEVPQMEDIKMFIELAFHEWVIFEKRYDFTVMVNKRLSRFSIPYRLQNGRLIQYRKVPIYIKR